MILKRQCEIDGVPEVSELKEGMDFREPQYRREVFLRFYEFHLKYKSHPGGVYYLFPYLAEKYNMDLEQKLWFAFLNGCTQNPLTTMVIFNKYPNFADIDLDEMEAWHWDNWRKLDYDTDRRYQKGHLVEMIIDYKSHIGERTQVEFFESFYVIHEMVVQPYESFDKLWGYVINNFKMYGRLSTFSYLEYLRIMGLEIDCSNLFMHDKSGSKSHRNALMVVMGRDDLDWKKGNEENLPKGHTKEIMSWAEEEGRLLLVEAIERIDHEDVGYFTLESTLCCYKSWHRVNRRYPNVYNDMLHNRIKKAEGVWGEIFQDFWEARQEYLPIELRIEDCPTDLGLHKTKQNWYRLTGEVIMMDNEYDCFTNGYLDSLIKPIEIDEKVKTDKPKSKPRAVKKNPSKYLFDTEFKKENTIFDKLSLNRDIVKWEDYLYALTPVEKHEGIYVKREDKFATLGYGGINGSKLRQAIWIFHRFVSQNPNFTHMFSGTSVKSPQLPMGSAVALHYGKESMHVLGATKPETAIKREMVEMATWFTAKFDIINIGYNHNLQNRVKHIMKNGFDNDFYLEYGITTTENDKMIEAFHRIGAEQVRNIPDDVETLILPAGSCNSTTSILYGIHLFKPKSLKKVYLIGIGPNKIKFIEQRLNSISRIIGENIKCFKRNFTNNPELNIQEDEFFDYEYELIHHDLHTTGYVSYQDEMPFEFDNIELHPTYEGKVMTYVKDKLPEILTEKSLFWIIGSKPRIENMLEFCPELGKIPDTLVPFVFEDKETEAKQEQENLIKDLF